MPRSHERRFSSPSFFYFFFFFFFFGGVPFALRASDTQGGTSKKKKIMALGLCIKAPPDGVGVHVGTMRLLLGGEGEGASGQWQSGGKQYDISTLVAVCVCVWLFIFFFLCSLWRARGGWCGVCRRLGESDLRPPVLHCCSAACAQRPLAAGKRARPSPQRAAQSPSGPCGKKKSGCGVVLGIGGAESWSTGAPWLNWFTTVRYLVSSNEQLSKSAT